MSSSKSFFQDAEFLAGAKDVEQLPKTRAVEVAFVGRSNVGKSSLINAILSRKGLARVSKNPGATNQINFYAIGGAKHKLTLVDLPGYGYAKVSKKERGIWDRLIFDYLCGRPNLKRVFMLVDARHGLKESDISVMDLLDEMAVVYQVILTKCDDAKAADIKKHGDEITKLQKKHPALFPEYLATSSDKNIGVEEMRKIILNI